MLVSKIFRKLKSYLIFAFDYLIPGNTSITVEEAEEWLQSVSRDPDSSCYTEHMFKYKGGEYDLSVVIPAYNSEKWVKTAVDSVLEQKTRFSFEVIIVNDGSTDTTGIIISGYKQNQNVTIINQENKGLSGARNAGIAVSRGNYLMFVDSDDWLLPGSLEALLDCAYKTGSEVVASNYIVAFPDGRTRAVAAYKHEAVDPTSAVLQGQWSKIYKREIFEHLKFPEKYWFEDTICAQIVWPMIKKCYTIPQLVYAYFNNSSGITSKAPKSPKSVDSFYVMRKLLDDKSRFNIEIDEKALMSFLSMVRLTYNRTKFQERKTRICIFVLQCEMLKKYFGSFEDTAIGSPVGKALVNRDYRRYLLACEK